jgi:uncharacterized membrane protein YqjE
MAILQALFSFIAKSAGRVLNAIFGWAVIALFGKTTPKQQVLLSGLVGLAALWPLLLVGVFFPKLAALVLAFVPMTKKIPSGIIRAVWIVLAAAVPIIVGLVVASKAPPATPPEPAFKRWLRGFPITLGLSCAFFLMFITVPVLRVLSIVRGRKDEHVPCTAEDRAYNHIASDIDLVLRRHHLDARRSEPSWWLAGPSNVLRKLGGKALRGFMPAHLAYWTGPELEVAFYPSDILIRGKKSLTAHTHGLLAEALARGPGLQTTDPQAQEIERQIHRVWHLYDENPHYHLHSRALGSRVHALALALSHINIEYEDWQVLYRELAQLARTLEGEQQLLDPESTEEAMKHEPIDRPLALSSTGELINQLVKQTSELVKTEVALARAEIKEDIRNEVKMASGLGVAAVCALCTLNMLLVAVAMALATRIAPWASALIVAAVVLAVGTVAGIVGWAKRVRAPMEKTQKTLKEDLQWARERIS